MVKQTSRAVPSSRPERSAGTGNLSRYRKANNTTTEANQKGHLVGAKKIAAGDTNTQAIRKISQPCSSLLSQPCRCSAEFAHEATNRAIKGRSEERRVGKA